MHISLKGRNNSFIMSKDIVSPFAQLSLKPTTKTVKSRHASTSSSTSSVASQQMLGLPVAYQSYPHLNENAIIDDDEDVSRNDTTTPLVSPNLLATSADNTASGRLLPSLSTISLLSLSREMELSSPSDHMKRKSVSRNTSFSSTARAPFQMHQQRHQQYYNASRRTSQQLQQPIPIINSTVMTPDTPTFGPTSLASSPSGFILSQQQLPASFQQQRHAFPGIVRHNSQQFVGNMSPMLDPIQDEPDVVPMTPLMLSANSPLVEAQDDE